MVGYARDMTDERHNESPERPEDATGPPDGKTHEATTPPGQGDRDEDAVTDAEERLEQAGGGH